MKFCALLSAVLLMAAASHGWVDYTGHMLIRARATDAIQLAYLRQLQISDESLDFWTDVFMLDKPVDIHIRSEGYEALALALNSASIQHYIKVEDLGRAIAEERQSIQKRREMTKDLKAFDLETYHTYDEIVAFLKELESAPNSLVTLSPLATTFEDRRVELATISKDGSNTKPVIVMECAVHAREWAAASTCLWFINELATKYDSDADVKNLLDGFDWKISPVTNPDGYSYSWTTDRLWRKNRRPLNVCYGVDINRNFDINFGGAGSSAVQCSDTYHGEQSFSEPESSGVRDTLIANRPRVKAAISIHTYSQLWMSPYGWTHALPKDYPEMLRVMEIGVAALEATYGTDYTYGNHADAIYVASGVTVDHAYDVENITYSYLLEVRDTGKYGFELPADQIAPTAIETWNGIKAMALEILKTL